MKHLSLVIFLFIILINISVTGNAEYIFKKDGSIIKGTIIRDDPQFITAENESGVPVRIGRNDILRILYTELYIGKVYVRLTSGEVIEGYQVEEDRDNYTFRKDIARPEEFVLSRKKVMFIARTNPTDLTGDSSIERIFIRWSPPFKPAKLYRIYLRENKKDEQFKVIGETGDTSYTIRNLNKSASYEVYVTAVGDTGEESLPSEKIITGTIPYPPRDLVLTEQLSADRKTVKIALAWKAVKDETTRVKSYTVYKIDDGTRKKLGNVAGCEFVIKDVTAEGKHRFAVVSVNDLGTESEDVTAVYSAGYRINTRVSGAYLVPLADMGVISEWGFGGLLDCTMGDRKYSAGMETGYLKFLGADDDIKTMTIFPVLAVADYRLPLFYKFYTIYTISLRPVFKAGVCYNMTEYIKHPLGVEHKKDRAGFNTISSAGLFTDMSITDYISISGGAEYSAIFEKSGTVSFLSFSFGAAIIF